MPESAFVFEAGTEIPETLREAGFAVPTPAHFEVESWKRDPDAVLAAIDARFPSGSLVLRRSAWKEYGDNNTHVRFQGAVSVPEGERNSLKQAIDGMAGFFCGTRDRIVLQAINNRIKMTGVILSRLFDDGSPYYVINYDVPSGSMKNPATETEIGRTVYVYGEVRDEDFDSTCLRAVLDLARRLEYHFDRTGAGTFALNIVFAVDTALNTHLLQVRRMRREHCRSSLPAKDISVQIRLAGECIDSAMRPRPDLFGNRTIFSVMADWKPAQSIGLGPPPLTLTLYRELFTRRTWNLARSRMGYRALPPVELMISLAGCPYIDVRASFNSFLPAGLASDSCKALLEAWLDRLDLHPELHDRVEFEIMHGVLDFDFPQSFAGRYGGLLSFRAYLAYRDALRSLTLRALLSKGRGSLGHALEQIEKLRVRQCAPVFALPASEKMIADHTPFELLAHTASLLEECRELGTIPFAVTAQHAFMAESLLRSAVRRGALHQERMEQVMAGIRTEKDRFNDRFRSVFSGHRSPAMFLAEYGHIRAASYDILSPCYAQKPDLFNGKLPPVPDVEQPEKDFLLSYAEQRDLGRLLHENSFHVSPEEFLNYARTAFVGREYARSVFTRHLSIILELLAAWGSRLGLSRAQVAMLSLEDILVTLFAPLSVANKAHFLARINEWEQSHDPGHSVRLASVIRSRRDTFVAVQSQGKPFFTTAGQAEGAVCCLNEYSAVPPENLANSIVCIESADFGYDWIFARGIRGLVTCFGGKSSHMARLCADYGLPAAIGCGSGIYERIAASRYGHLDCAAGTVQAL